MIRSDEDARELIDSITCKLERVVFQDRMNHVTLARGQVVMHYEVRRRFD